MSIIQKLANLVTTVKDTYLWGVQAADNTNSEKIESTSSALNVWLKNNFVDQSNNVANIEQKYLPQRCAAGADRTLGNTGGAGDLLHRIDIETGVTSVVIKDGGTTVYTWTIATGETGKVLNWTSVSGAWTLNPAVAACVGTGRFKP